MSHHLKHHWTALLKKPHHLNQIHGTLKCCVDRPTRRTSPLSGTLKNHAHSLLNIIRQQLTTSLPNRPVVVLLYYPVVGTPMTKPRSLAYLRLRTALVASVTLLAALVGFLSPSPRDLNPPQTSALLFPRALLERSPLNGRVFSHEEGAYAFGRWRQPTDDVSFHSDADEGATAALSNVLRTKAWHYSSFNSDRFFIGMAIVKVRYCIGCFLATRGGAAG